MLSKVHLVLDAELELFLFNFVLLSLDYALDTNQVMVIDEVIFATPLIALMLFTIVHLLTCIFVKFLLTSFDFFVLSCFNHCTSV